MTITTYTDREIALRQQLAAATQLAQLNGEIAAELKADKLALEAAIEASRKQQLAAMTEVKMPETGYFTTKNGRLWTFPDEVDQTGLELRIYTEAQMKQYGDDRAREALIEASRKQEAVAQFDWGLGRFVWLTKYSYDKHHRVPLYAAPVVAPDVPTEITEVAQVAIENVLREYNYPANPKNAARAGWRACRLHIAAMGGTND